MEYPKNMRAGLLGSANVRKRQYINNSVPYLGSLGMFPTVKKDLRSASDSYQKISKQNIVSPKYHINDHDDILVSALCVTYRRPTYLKSAINDFMDQTHKNKELLILYDDDDELTQSFRDSSDYDDSIKWFKMDSKLNLGELRNKSVELANGEYVTQWDDDDLYHKERIRIQLDFAVKTNKAVLLDAWIILNTQDERVYSYIREPGWEGSILTPKKYQLK